jgi:ABC-type branched-subunit amino acid transport system substrate-binding protein
MSARARCAVLCLPLLVAATACGTTVPVAQRQVSVGELADPFGIAGPASPASAATSTATPGAAAPTSGATPGSATPDGVVPVAQQPGASPVASRAGGSRGPAHLPPVEVGVVTASTQAVTALAGMGYSVKPGDPKAESAAMADWINVHGGLAGHPVRLVYYTRSITANPADDDQAACDSMTQDHHAVAVIDGTIATMQLASCLSARGSLLLGGGTGVFTEHDFASARAFWSPYQLAGERIAHQLVARLDAMHWIAPGDKVGLLYNQNEPFASIAKVARQDLVARGHAPVAEAGFDQSQTATMNGIVLAFSRAGVNKVVVVDTGGQVMLLFVPAARSQGYHPAYTITTADVPNTVETLVSSNDLKGSVGIGWSPAVDVAPSRAPAKNAAGQLCAKIFSDAKQDVSGPFAGAIAAAYCDGFLFLKHVVDLAGAVTPAAFRGAVQTLGTSYVSAVTFATRFGPGRYDGVERTRDLRYDTGCSCFQYASGPVAVP